MPYTVKKRGARNYAIVKKSGGRETTVGHSTSRRKAMMSAGIAASADRKAQRRK